MKELKRLLTACLLILSLGIQAQTQIIAHRGYWKAEGAAQNSIAALQKAAEAGVYGSEFDVQLTADGIVVVNHDDEIDGYTIARTPYNKLKNLKLKNGEKLPTLEEYLKAGKDLPHIQLILEIKPHATQAQENQAVTETVRLVKQYGMEKQVEYISFSLNVCEQLAAKTQGAEIAYLNGDLTPQAVKEKGLTGIDYQYRVFYKHPEWVEEARKAGLKTNAWTVNKEKDMKRLATMGLDYITTNHPIEAMQAARPTER